MKMALKQLLRAKSEAGAGLDEIDDAGCVDHSNVD
jgi:hypothetical protein